MTDFHQIPLFPLPRVLFPKMILPLHVFEKCYREMIRECLIGQKIFGIISEDESKPGTIGTTASIYRVAKKYKDGRYDLLVLGEMRFQLKSLLLDKSYPRGEVEYFNDLPGEMLARNQTEELLGRYWSFIARLGLKPEQRKHLESILEQLNVEREISYIIGQTIGLDVHGQRLLLAENTSNGRIDRLTRELNRLSSVHNLARDLFENDNFDPRMN